MKSVGPGIALLLALGARGVVRSQAGGERELPLDDFFAGYRRTAMVEGEVLCAVRVPGTPPVVHGGNGSNGFHGSNGSNGHHPAGGASRLRRTR